MNEKSTIISLAYISHVTVTVTTDRKADVTSANLFFFFFFFRHTTEFATEDDANSVRTCKSGDCFYQT